MMRHLYYMIAQVLLSLVRGAFNNKQITDAASSSEQAYDQFALHLAHINETHENVGENAILTTGPNKSVQTDENNKPKDASSEGPSRFASDNHKEFKPPNTVRDDKLERSKHKYSNVYHNGCSDFNEINNNGAPSFAAYLRQCEELDRDNNTTFSTDDGESIEGYDSVLESPPLNPHGSPSEGVGVPEFAELADFVESAGSQNVSAREDLESASNLDPAMKAGSKTRFCAHCSRSRRENQENDRSGKRAVTSSRWLIFRRMILLENHKKAQAQCSKCDFGVEKKVARRRKLGRVKKFFSKISGRKSKAVVHE